MNKSATLKPAQPPAILFRNEIEAALAEGVSIKAMTLRLTLKDGRRLRRDESVPLEQISYSGGEMHYLGVKVTEGGVAVSVLDQAPQA